MDHACGVGGGDGGGKGIVFPSQSLHCDAGGGAVGLAPGGRRAVVGKAGKASGPKQHVKGEAAVFAVQRLGTVSFFQVHQPPVFVGVGRLALIHVPKGKTGAALKGSVPAQKPTIEALSPSLLQEEVLVPQTGTQTHHIARRHRRQKANHLRPHDIPRTGDLRDRSCPGGKQHRQLPAVTGRLTPPGARAHQAKASNARRRAIGVVKIGQAQDVVTQLVDHDSNGAAVAVAAGGLHPLPKGSVAAVKGVIRHPHPIHHRSRYHANTVVKIAQRPTVPPVGRAVGGFVPAVGGLVTGSNHHQRKLGPGKTAVAVGVKTTEVHIGIGSFNGGLHGQPHVVAGLFLLLLGDRGVFAAGDPAVRVGHGERKPTHNAIPGNTVAFRCRR
ncbi:hypothetical protein HRbin09_01501 [bacterium HR09]|nr:hypothetical protein HRbin09_01501 [bacterium HR09]